MERDDMLALLKALAEGLIAGEMKPALWARTIEGLISSNLDVVPDLEDAALRLADFGVRGAVNPLSESDLAAIARRLIALAESA